MRGYTQDQIMEKLDIDKVIALATEHEDIAELENLLEIKAGIEQSLYKDQQEIGNEICYGAYGNLGELLERISEGTIVQYISDDCGDYYLVYPKYYPWDIPEEEKGLTKANINKALMSCIKRITTDDFEAGRIHEIDI